MGAVLTLGLVVPAAILLHVSVEAPVDRWRQRRAWAAGARVSQEDLPAKVQTLTAR